MPSNLDTLNFAQLVAEGAATLDRFEDGIAGYNAWATGSATGGPNGDGNYPLPSLGAPGYVLVPCPAKIAALAADTGAPSSPLTAEAVSALPAATTSGGDEAFPAVDNDGVLKRFTLNLYAARKTADLDVLPGSEFAEWLSCLSSTGAERRYAVSALTRIAGDVIDPTKPPYNVKYDFKKAKPSYTTTGSNVITTADPVFSAADLGKLISAGGGSTQGPLFGYIGLIIDSKHVGVYSDAALTIPLNATSNSTNEVMWGSDSTAGMQAAFDAAEPVSIYHPGKVVLIGGVCCVTQLRFGSISVVGLSANGCGFAALPLAGSQQPVFADKNTGAYATRRPDGYSLRGLHFYGQRYTQFYSTFRRNLEIRGGNFSAFYRGAPYAAIEDIISEDSMWDGIATAGAFAGQFNNIRALQNAHCGLRMGFWDLNGQNWHVEGNGAAGVFSYMPGANVSTVRASYNGSSQGGFTGGGYWPHQYGANWCEAGFGNTVSNLRMQESWGHSLVIASQDPLNQTSGGGAKNAFFIGTFDDTGNIAPGHGGTKVRLPGVRAMIYLMGNTVKDNTVNLVTGAGQVQATNWATNGVWEDGYPTNNHIDLRTPGITNDPADWYAGNAATDTVATARGYYGSTNGGGAARGNVIVVNGQTAP